MDVDEGVEGGDLSSTRRQGKSVFALLRPCGYETHLDAQLSFLSHISIHTDHPRHSLRLALPERDSLEHDLHSLRTLRDCPLDSVNDSLVVFVVGELVGWRQRLIGHLTFLAGGDGRERDKTGLLKGGGR